MKKRIRMANVAAKPPLEPQDIRRIREALGLTQVEAGELLGGGLRAFQKYESGQIKPAASVANILRMLDERPDALTTLTGKKSKPVDATGLRPFEVSGEHVKVLKDRALVALVRRLLASECLRAGIPRDRIHVASNLTAADGGVDGKVTWSGGPERTEFIPARNAVVQVKAADIGPAEAAKDILTSKGGLEPEIADVLNAGGAYVMVCNRPYVEREVAKRADAIRKAVKDAGLAVEPDRIVFRDADQVAEWVNANPSAAIWLLEQTQQSRATPFRSWAHWSGRSEHERIAFIADERLEMLRVTLRTRLSSAKGVARLVGLSGVGKSRLALEALGPQDDEGEQTTLSDIVVYAALAEVGALAVTGAVQALVDANARVVVVVDGCDRPTHDTLAGIVTRSGSQVSLLTIDHEVPDGPEGDEIQVSEAPVGVIEAILKDRLPDLASEDFRRLVQLSSSVPQMAMLVSEAWRSSSPVAAITRDDLINRIVVGRNPLIDQQLVIKSAMIVGTFGLLGYQDEAEGELEFAAQQARGLSADDLRAGIEELRRRGVIQLRGRYVSLQPRPVALALAARQWKEWSVKKRDELLAGEAARSCSVRLAKRLAQLNTLPIASEVASQLCRRSGPLDSLAEITVDQNAELISELSEISTKDTAELLDRVLGPLSREELFQVEDRPRRQIVWAVQKIAFVPDTFADGARLLFALALAENERWGNNATGQFISLFPVMLADTAAGPVDRLALLDDLLASEDEDELLLIVKALEAGAKTSFFSRMNGTESHGLRPALKSWQPTYMKEALDYVLECLERLLTLALRDDAVGRAARHCLASDMRSLVTTGCISFVEKAVAAITAKFGSAWSEALSELGLVLNYDRDALEEEEVARVRSLTKVLSPTSLEGRVQLLVTEMPWDYPCDGDLDFDKKGKRQRADIDKLVSDLLKKPKLLQGLLPQLSSGVHRMVRIFGMSLGEQAADPLSWAGPLTDTFLDGDVDQRNPDLLAGFYVGIARREPEAFEKFKRDALNSEALAQSVPGITLQAGITASDVDIVRQAVRSGRLPFPSLNAWQFGGELAKLPPSIVGPLFSDLFAKARDGGWAAGVDLLGMYVHGRSERLDELRPQLREMVEAIQFDKTRRETMVEHHFAQLAIWLLKKGRVDADACNAALALTKRLIELSRTDKMVSDRTTKPLIPLLLRNFPEIVWPLFSQAIAAEPKSAWQFETTVSDMFSMDGVGTSALLELREDALFGWAEAYPEVGPSFLAVTIPLLGPVDQVGHQSFHPVIQRLIDEFGERADVQRALQRNLFTFGWTGSPTAYYEKFYRPFEALQNHSKAAVRRWAKSTLEVLRKRSSYDRREEIEREAMWDEG